MRRVIPVAILCGGKGARMTGSGEEVPKPLVEIGGLPILWHVMSIYAAHGLTRFILLLGHGAAEIEAFAATLQVDWDVTCLDTGLETPTGGRVARAAHLLEDDTFCLTYADGVADIDLDALLAFHESEGAAATMTVVKPQNPWGVARLDGDRVSGFAEKPPLDCWVNAGFFVMEPRALDPIGPDDVLERAPLEALATGGELAAFRHGGFWDCMDTYKDTLLLNDLWDEGRAPWRPLVEVSR
jgi:glucose-1-phosphate cytidylyltransferase